MIKPVAIKKGAEEQPALNFEFLRSTGIQLLQRYAGQKWTDFNLHDPGVTILEQLCFAITDLAYRTDFPITDLLADENGEIDYTSNAFYMREEVLTSSPVHINDFRKVIIDQVDEIDNVWLYPISSAISFSGLSGLYQVLVQVNSETAGKMNSDSGIAGRIKSRVREVFAASRNLCEDIVTDVVVLSPLKLTVEADILVSSGRNAEEVLARVYHQLARSMNQPVRYYTEKELIERGMEYDEIFDGPLLRKGFIPNSELQDRKSAVDPTELTRAISQVPGVLSVKRLKIVNGQSGRSNKPMKIPENSFPLLDISGSENQIKLYVDKFELPVKRPLFRGLFQKLRESDNRGFISAFYQRPSAHIKGVYRNNEKYHSIQEQFPRIYGIGSEGLLKSSTKLRKAQARQLKGYLLLFEQVLANYAGQVSNLRNLFSIDLEKGAASTIFKNPLYQVPGVQDLLTAFTSSGDGKNPPDWEEFKRDVKNGYERALDESLESDAAFNQRKNKLFDHLLARFNEFLISHPVNSFTALYDSSLQETRVNPELQWKSEILRKIPALGYNRVRGKNYLREEEGDSMDFSARMRSLLYIPTPEPGRMLSDALDPNVVSVESFPVEPNSPDDLYVQTESEVVSWSGEIPDILIDDDAMAKLRSERLIAESEEMPKDAFLLRHQKVTILKFALDIRNYRIAPDGGAGGQKDFLVIYKSPDEKLWTPVSRFPSQNEAMKGLKGFIAYIRKINTRSEGFYLAEHVLLRPDLNSKVFGFRFIAKNGQRLMEHVKWMTFQEREDTVNNLMDLLNGEGDLPPEKLSAYCRLNLHLSAAEFPEAVDGVPEPGTLQSLVNYFRLLSANRANFLARFEMVIRGDNYSMIQEDFFSLRMTAVFPSWPARFQDKSFRSAAESMFRLNVPAHLSINFKWLNINDMKRFEFIYNDWKKFIAGGQQDDNTREELRGVLVQLLADHKG